MEKAYTKWKIEEIIEWCVANGEVEWLKTTSQKIVNRPIYPKVPNVSKTGKNTMVYDKTQEPIGYEESKISFVELKSEFIATFFESQKKEKKPSMYDLIAAL